MLKRVAVTGGIASGKTAACKIFKELGACVVSADEIVHRQLTPNTSVGQKVIALFGNEILTNNTIDRNKVAEIAFNQPKLLLALQSIMHPAVLDEIEKSYQTAKQKQNVAVFVAEIPLLFEIGADKLFDCSVCVMCDYNTCVDRYKLSTGHNKEDFDKRMSYQMSPEEKAKKATWTIHNNGTIEGMVESITKIYLSLASNNNPTIALRSSLSK